MLEPESGVFRSLNASVEGIAGRNPDGSIDYGYYRRQASRLRRAKLRESSRRAARFAGLIVAITIVAAAIVAVTARGPQFPPDAGVVNFAVADALCLASASTRPLDRR